MEVAFRTKNGVVSVDAPELEVARLVAACRGYHVDVEPMEPGKYRLTASATSPSGGGAVIRLNGESLEAVSVKLIETLTPSIT